MTSEERVARTAVWLKQLGAWRESGLKLAAYARQHQLKRWEAYEWRRRLQRRGLWIEKTQGDPGRGSKIRARAAQQAAVRFARVKVKKSPPRIATPYAPMTVRVWFGNERCAELQLLDAAQLAELFAVLWIELRKSARTARVL